MSGQTTPTAPRSTVTIRQYQPTTDMRAVVGLVHEAFDETAAYVVRGGALPGFVAVEAARGTIVGVLLYQLDPFSYSPAKASQTGELKILVVHREWRRKHEGMQLEHAFRLTYPTCRVRVETPKSEPGKVDTDGFYRKLGYSSDSDIPAQTRKGNMRRHPVWR